MLERTLTSAAVSVFLLATSNLASAQSTGRGRLYDDPSGGEGWAWLVVAGLMLGGLFIYSMVEEKRAEKEREERDRKARHARRQERQKGMTADERHNDNVMDLYGALVSSDRLLREVRKMSEKEVKRELRESLREFESHDNRATIIKVLEHHDISWNSLGSDPDRLRDDLLAITAAMIATKRFGELKVT